MLLKVYSVRDTKAGIYSPPFLAKTFGEAERAIKELVRDPQTMVSKYPEDYDLFYLGDFDDIAGKMIPLDTPQHTIKAVQLLQQRPPLQAAEQQ